MTKGGKGGKGWGVGSPNLKPGKAHKSIAKDFKEEQLTGKKNAGPSRSQVIMGASSKGFASRSYRKVYGAYRNITEEVLSQKKVPYDYRRFVKRYFQIIKPR